MKGHNPPKELLRLMAWTIFVTNVPTGEADFEKILKLYRFRWQIEIIFKIWKSYMHMAKVHNVSYLQLQVLLTARFIMIIICSHHLFLPYNIRIKQKCNRLLSMMKFINYLMKNPEKISQLLICLNSNQNKIDQAIQKLIRYCTYENRIRLNIKQMEYTILLSWRVCPEGLNKKTL